MRRKEGGGDGMGMRKGEQKNRRGGEKDKREGGEQECLKEYDRKGGNRRGEMRSGTRIG